MFPPFDPGRAALALSVVLVGLAAVGVAMRRARAGAAGQAAGDAPYEPESDAVLVLHASQTGSAREFADATADLLRRSGRAVHVASLGAATMEQLRRHRHAFLVVSTTGDGEPPDEARAFLHGVMEDRALRRVSLAGLSFGLLALGDRSYADFCGFGIRVDRWLMKRGARPLFPRIEVDALQQDGLSRWPRAVAEFAGPAGGDQATGDWVWQAAPWEIARGRVLNPGSVGEPMLHLELVPAGGAPLPAWESGDLARLRVPGDYRQRDYSVASVPADGRLHLVVRRVLRPDGQAGAVSGWLAEAAPGSVVELRLLAHPSFRLGGNAGRPLVLVGNGAGIAGLLGHLRARDGDAGARHWLLFGERQRAHDRLFHAEIEDWRSRGHLERVDLAFSRDADDGAYVQDRLRAAAPDLRAWIDAGAAIYVCGSRKGMAEGVHDALVDVLGSRVLQALAAEGRYRRDVY